MKSVVDSFFTAFSLYSAIPMPKTSWDKSSMRYALCFFPLIGVIIGLLQLLWIGACIRFRIVSGLYAAVAALIPVLVSGGIHMDGFIDTCDALSSHGLMEKKLEILKDPHTGAFGVAFCAAYLLFSYGLWQQVYQTPALITLALLGYTVSRAFSALSVATFPCAKSAGLAHAFSDAAAKGVVKTVCAVVIVAALGASAAVSPVWGGLAVLCAVFYFLLHKRFCLWEFGGNTGDLAGFFLQNLELVFLVFAVLGSVV